jgi:hypothetical protein
LNLIPAIRATNTNSKTRKPQGGGKLWKFFMGSIWETNAKIQQTPYLRFALKRETSAPHCYDSAG